MMQNYIHDQKEIISFDTKRVISYISYVYNNRRDHLPEEALKEEVLNTIEQL